MNALKNFFTFVLGIGIIIFSALIILDLKSNYAFGTLSLPTYAMMIAGLIIEITIINTKDSFYNLMAIFAVLIIIFPIILLTSMRSPLGIFKGVGSMSDWIGFWGSYIGSIIGVGGAVIASVWTTKKQLKASQKQLESQLKNSARNDWKNTIRLNDLTVLNELIRITGQAIVNLDRNGISSGFKEIKKDSDKSVDSKALGIKAYNYFSTELSNLTLKDSELCHNEDLSDTIKNILNYIEDLRKCAQSGGSDEIYEQYSETRMSFIHLMASLIRKRNELLND